MTNLNSNIGLRVFNGYFRDSRQLNLHNDIDKCEILGHLLSFSLYKAIGKEVSFGKIVAVKLKQRMSHYVYSTAFWLLLHCHLLW